MLGWVVQTTAVAASLAAVAALAGRWRRVGPEVRHLLWLLVILKLVVPPGVGWSWTVAAPAPAPVVEPAPRDPDPAPVGPTPDPMPALPEAVEPGEAPPPVAAPPPVPAPRPARRWAVEPSSVVMAAWWAGSAAVVAWELGRIVRFGRRLRRGAMPAPGWVEREVGELAERFGVRPPAVRVASGLASPLLWCAGRPRLFVPEALAGEIGPDRWRAVIAHELAHLARRDPWVARLELLAEAVWWWNPLFWLARHRLRAEAELACDARVVRLWPDRRLRYAEALVDVCSRLVRPPLPPPALGVGGGSRAARSLERRLLMILDEPRPRPALARSALPLTVLAALALPAWSLARQEPAPKDPGTATAPAAPDQPAPAAPDLKPPTSPVDPATVPDKPLAGAEAGARTDLSFLKDAISFEIDDLNRMLRLFFEQPAARALQDELRVARKRLDAVQRVAKEPKDPALIRQQKEVERLEQAIIELWSASAGSLSRQFQRDDRERSLNQAVMRARVDGKRAEVQKAEALRESARIVTGRNRKLRERGQQYMTVEELERSELDLRVAEAEVDIKKAALAEAEVDLRRASPSGDRATNLPPAEYDPVADADAARPARASLADLRDAIGLRRIELDGKRAGMGAAEAAVVAARRDRDGGEVLVKRQELAQAALDHFNDQLREAEERQKGASREVAAAEIRLLQAERRVKTEEARLRRNAERAKAQLTRAETYYRRKALSRAEYDKARDEYDDLMSEIDPDHKPTPALAAPDEAPARQ